MKTPKAKSIEEYLEYLKEKGYKIPNCKTCKIKKNNKNACKNCEFNILLCCKSDLKDKQ